jgi:hypothetical protein
METVIGKHIDKYQATIRELIRKNLFFEAGILCI